MGSVGAPGAWFQVLYVVDVVDFVVPVLVVVIAVVDHEGGVDFVGVVQRLVVGVEGVHEGVGGIQHRRGISVLGGGSRVQVCGERGEQAVQCRPRSGSGGSEERRVGGE